MTRSESVYGNIQKPSTVKKAVKSKQKYIRRFGDDTNADYSAEVFENEYIGDLLGVKNIEIGKNKPGTCLGFDIDNGIIVGNIRMGFGHYRISMAIASAAHSMGSKDRLERAFYQELDRNGIVMKFVDGRQIF